MRILCIAKNSHIFYQQKITVYLEYSCLKFTYDVVNFEQMRQEDNTAHHDQEPGGKLYVMFFKSNIKA